MKKAVASLLIMLLCVSMCACDGGTYSRAEVILGDGIALHIGAKGQRAKEAADEMFRLAGEVFSDMDLSDSGSALSRFNDGDGVEPTEINVHIYKVLELAKTAHEKSGGAFDVTSYPLSLLWKVDSASIRNVRPDFSDPIGSAQTAVPSMDEVRDTLAHVGMDKIDFYESGGKYFLVKSDPLAKIDLGGIAKGYFTDLCVGIAKSRNLKSCLIDLSGNIYLYGAGISGGGDWTVGIINPRPRGGAGASLSTHVAAVRSGGGRSFVTSGDYQRFYYYDPAGGETPSAAALVPVCHVIDPRSGLPVGVGCDEGAQKYFTDYSAVCSATVSGENSALCDAFSTAALVLGAEKAAELLRREGLRGLLLTNPDLPYEGNESAYSAQGAGTVLLGKGAAYVVGEWDFMDGYDGYKNDYVRAEAA